MHLTWKTPKSTIWLRGGSFANLELEYQKEEKGVDPETGNEVILVQEDALSGINKLLKALEGINGRTTLDKRGELRNAFYLEMKRRPGERIAEFCARFRTALADLRSEGVQLPSGEVGWFFKAKLGLDPLRIQLLDTALQGAEEYEAIEREVLRLFKELHAQDPLVRRAGGDGKGSPLLQRFLSSQSGPSRSTSYAPSSASSMPRSYRSSSSASSGRFGGGFRKPFPPKQVMVSEVEETENDDEELIEADDDGGDPGIGDIIRSEAEALAAELDEAVEQGLDASTLQEIEETVENAAEALITMKEARTKLQEVKKDRGYGRAGTGSEGASKVSQKKAAGKHPCFDCGLPGHWAGDPECTQPGKGLGRMPMLKKPYKQVKVVETLNTEHVEGGEEGGHEVLAVSSVPLPPALMVALDESHRKPKEVNAVSATLTADKRLVGALDSACNRTCTGPDWLEGFLKGLKKAPQAIQDLVITRPERETFRFGNGGTQVSLERWRLPTVVGGRLVCFWTSLVQVPSLGLLLGLDFLEAVGTYLSFLRRELRCETLSTTSIPLKQLMAGHYLLPLLPSSWPGLGTQRWRRFGQDGIVELQMDSRDWVQHCFRGRKGLKVAGHDHMLTEHSMQIANLVCTVMSSPVDSPAVQDCLMTGRSDRRSTPTTSSTTRSTSCFPPLPKSHGPSAKSQHTAMAKNDSSTSRKVPMGSKGRRFVAGAKTFFALAALALSLGGNSRSLARASPEAGERESATFPSRGQSVAAMEVQFEESGRLRSPEATSWPPSFLHRGPSGGRHGDGNGSQGSQHKDPKGCARGGSSTGKEAEFRREERGGSRDSHRSAGRPALSSKRFASIGRSSSRPHRGFGHCGKAQGEGEANDCHPEREVSTADCGEVGCQEQRRPTKELSKGIQRNFNEFRTSSSLSSSGRNAQDGNSDAKVAEADRRASRPSGLGLDHDGRERGGRSVGQHLGRREGSHPREPERCLRPESDGSVWGLHRGSDRGSKGNSAGPVKLERDQHGFNPFSINQTLKKGQAQLIAQAWSKHEAERLKTSLGPRRLCE